MMDFYSNAGSPAFEFCLSFRAGGLRFLTVFSLLNVYSDHEQFFVNFISNPYF